MNVILHSRQNSERKMIEKNVIIEVIGVLPTAFGGICKLWSVQNRWQFIYFKTRKTILFQLFIYLQIRYFLIRYFRAGTETLTKIIYPIFIKKLTLQSECVKI